MHKIALFFLTTLSMTTLLTSTVNGAESAGELRTFSPGKTLMLPSQWTLTTSTVDNTAEDGTAKVDMHVLFNKETNSALTIVETKERLDLLDCVKRIKDNMSTNPALKGLDQAEVVNQEQIDADGYKVEMCLLGPCTVSDIQKIFLLCAVRSVGSSHYVISAGLNDENLDEQTNTIRKLVCSMGVAEY